MLILNFYELKKKSSQGNFLKQENEWLKCRRDQLLYGNDELRCTTRQLQMETELNEERLIIEKRRLKQGVDITLTCEKNALEDEYIAFKEEYKLRRKNILKNFC
jgi:hypothetical protein